jgi:hypothetical protein
MRYHMVYVGGEGHSALLVTLAHHWGYTIGTMSAQWVLGLKGFSSGFPGSAVPTLSSCTPVLFGLLRMD